MNKYIFLLSLFWTITTAISAQNITRLEYSIDGFVAEGKGTVLEIADDSKELDSLFNIDISGLESGIHTIYFRVMNEDGVCSFAAERSFYIPEEPITEGIMALEYSIDEMIKEGDGEMIVLQNGTNTLDSTLLIDISILEPGIHNIYMWARNKLGVWSLPVKQSFLIPEPDTAKIEFIHYRIYNDDFESVWMTTSIDPSRKNVDSTIMVSTAGLDLGENYTIEFFAENNMAVRSFSAFLGDVSLRTNNPPQRMKEMLELSVSVNQNLEISMDSLFSDDDLILGDSLTYVITGTDNESLADFTNWHSDSLFALLPIEENAGTYNFWIKSTDLAGESDSIQVMLTVTGATGIFDDEIAENNFLIYPNPTTDFITIRNLKNDHLEYQVRLFNPTGQLLFYDNVFDNNYNLSLNGYTKGVYFIVIQNDEYKIRKRILKK